MAELIFYGSGMEVGRSCIELKSGNSRFLFDAGLKITPDKPEFPLTIPEINKINSVFLSHIHLDHTGALPQFFSLGLNCKVYCSEITKLLLPILLKDSWKVSKINGGDINYNNEHIEDVLKSLEVIEESVEIPLYDKEVKFKFLPAGHIPGAQSILLDLGDKKILYSGDLNLAETLITPSLSLDEFPENIDLMILESTYGNKNHVRRNEVIEDFLFEVEDTLKKGGVALIPTFSIGRAQELSIILTEKFPNENIILDGMAKQITETYIRSALVKNSDKLKVAYEKILTAKSKRQRSNAFEKSSIIITTSGMLDGGPVLYYLPKIANDENSSVLLTGYQAKETNGRKLLEKGFVFVDDEKVKINCNVKKFDLSAHAGKDDLMKIVEKIKPKKLVLNHGEGEALKILKSEVESKLKIECIIAKNNERIVF